MSAFRNLMHIQKLVQSHLALITLAILLPSLFSCGHMFLSAEEKIREKEKKRQEQLNTIMDYVLGHVQETLFQGQDSMKDLVTVVASETDLPQAVKKKYIDSMVKAFSGPVLYDQVKSFYRERLGEEVFFNMTGKLFDQQILDIHQKEKTDLDPQKFKEFEASRKQIKDWDKKEEIIESFDELNRVSFALKQSLKNYHEVLLRGLYLNKVSKIQGERLKTGLERMKTDMELQTGLFIKEVMKYTYQDLSVEDLEALQGLYKGESLQQVFGLIGDALNYAYDQQRKAFDQYIASTTP